MKMQILFSPYLLFLFASRTLLQSVGSCQLHPSRSAGNQTHRRRNARPAAVPAQICCLPLKNDGNGSKEKRRSHDVVLYAHVAPQTPTPPPLLDVPAPAGAHRENEALEVEEEPGFVAGPFGPMREKEC